MKPKTSSRGNVDFSQTILLEDNEGLEDNESDEFLLVLFCCRRSS